MQHTKKIVQLVSSLALISLMSSQAAYALHIDMKPGLWEHKFKMDSDSMSASQKAQMEQMQKGMEEMKKQFANMPPEQRKMMEEMMAKHGVKMKDGAMDMSAQGVSISKDGTSVKVCVTQEDIDSGDLPEQNSECQHKITQVSANTFKSVFSCKGAHPSEGEGTITFNDSKSYTGTAMLTTEIDNKPQTMHTEQSGQWLSSDCGDIKPRTHKKADKAP